MALKTPPRAWVQKSWDRWFRALEADGYHISHCREALATGHGGHKSLPQDVDRALVFPLNAVSTSALFALLLRWARSSHKRGGLIATESRATAISLAEMFVERLTIRGPFIFDLFMRDCDWSAVDGRFSGLDRVQVHVRHPFYLDRGELLRQVRETGDVDTHQVFSALVAGLPEHAAGQVSVVDLAVVLEEGVQDTFALRQLQWHIGTALDNALSTVVGRALGHIDEQIVLTPGAEEATVTLADPAASVWWGRQRLLSRHLRAGAAIHVPVCHGTRHFGLVHDGSSVGNRQCPTVCRY